MHFTFWRVFWNGSWRISQESYLNQILCKFGWKKLVSEGSIRFIDFMEANEAILLYTLYATCCISDLESFEASRPNFKIHYVKR